MFFFKFNKNVLKKIKAKNKKGKMLKKGFGVKTNAKCVATLKLKNKLLTFKKAKLPFSVTFKGITCIIKQQVNEK